MADKKQPKLPVLPLDLQLLNTMEPSAGSLDPSVRNMEVSNMPLELTSRPLILHSQSQSTSSVSSRASAVRYVSSSSVGESFGHTNVRNPSSKVRADLANISNISIVGGSFPPSANLSQRPRPAVSFYPGANKPVYQKQDLLRQKSEPIHLLASDPMFQKPLENVNLTYSNNKMNTSPIKDATRSQLGHKVQHVDQLGHKLNLIPVDKPPPRVNLNNVIQLQNSQASPLDHITLGIPLPKNQRFNSLLDNLVPVSLPQSPVINQNQSQKPVTQTLVPTSHNQTRHNLVPNHSQKLAPLDPKQLGSLLPVSQNHAVSLLPVHHDQTSSFVQQASNQSPPGGSKSQRVIVTKNLITEKSSGPRPTSYSRKGAQKSLLTSGNKGPRVPCSVSGLSVSSMPDLVARTLNLNKTSPTIERRKQAVKSVNKASVVQKSEGLLNVNCFVNNVAESYGGNTTSTAHGDSDSDEMELLNTVEEEARGKPLTKECATIGKKYYSERKLMRRYVDTRMSSASDDSGVEEEVTETDLSMMLKVHIKRKKRKEELLTNFDKLSSPQPHIEIRGRGRNGRGRGRPTKMEKGSSIDQLNVKRHRLWLAIMKKEIGKAMKARNYNTKEKAGSSKRIATACMRAQRQRAMASQKAMKDAVWRAKRLTREMQTHWRKFEREEKQQKKAKDKVATEQRKMDIDILEAKRQQRKLNFLITQTELYAHFMAKKMGQGVEEQEGDILARLNSDVSDERLRAMDDYDEVKMKEKAKMGAKGAADRHAADRVKHDSSVVKHDNHVLKESMNMQLSMSEAAENAGDRPQPSMFQGTLKPYQLKGMNWLCSLYDQGINGILADEMGLGKTVQALAFLAHVAETYGVWGPFLVITPASTLHNWQQEVARFLPEFKTVPYWGSPQERKVLRGFWTTTNLHTKSASFHLVVTSYQIVITDFKYFSRHAWQYMVLDEAQAIKSASSQRWKMLLEFKCRGRLLLSGTPIQNTMAELWSLLHFVMPALFDSHDEFSEWFSKDIEGHIDGSRGKVDEKQMSRLHLILKPFMLRRIKKDVEHELTDKIEVLLYCPLTIRQRLLYSALKQNIRLEELIAGLGLVGGSVGGGVSSLMNLVMQFRKVCNHPELFERREAKSPFLSSIPQLTLPRLLILGKPKCHAHSPRHSVFRADRVHSSLKNTLTTTEYLEVSESPYSFLRFCDIVPGEAEQLSTNLYRRWLHAAKRTANSLSQAYSWSKDSSTSSPLSLLLPIPHVPPDLIFTGQSSQFLAHRDLTISSMPETVSHRLIRSRLLPTNLLLPGSEDDGSMLTLPEHPHVPHPPIVRHCVPTPCPSFLHYLTPRATALPIQPYSHSRSAEYQVEDHLRVWVGPESSSCGYEELQHGRHATSDLSVLNYHPNPRGGLEASSPPHGWSGIVIPDKQSLISDAGKLFVLDSLLARLKEGGHRVLIYSQMTRMIDLLEEYMSHRQYSYMRLDGSSKIHERRDMVADFQQRQDIFVFLLSTRAGGLGINLTAADTVIFYDSDWNPTVDQQAMDRAHRLGQTRQVTVYRLICKGTIEERILQRAREKSEIQRMVIQGGSFKGKGGDLKPKEVVSLLLDDDEIEKRCRLKAEEEERLEEEKRSGKRPAGQAKNKVKKVKVEEETVEIEGGFEHTKIGDSVIKKSTSEDYLDGPKPLFDFAGDKMGPRKVKGRGGGKRGRPRGSPRGVGRAMDGGVCRGMASDSDGGHQSEDLENLANSPRRGPGRPKRGGIGSALPQGSKLPVVLKNLKGSLPKVVNSHEIKTDFGFYKQAQ